MMTSWTVSLKGPAFLTGVPKDRHSDLNNRVDRAVPDRAYGRAAPGSDGVTVIRLALTGVVVVGPTDFSRAVAPSHPAVPRAASPAIATTALVAGTPGRAACAGRRDGEPVTV